MAHCAQYYVLKVCHLGLEGGHGPFVPPPPPPRTHKHTNTLIRQYMSGSLMLRLSCANAYEPRAGGNETEPWSFGEATSLNDNSRWLIDRFVNCLLPMYGQWSTIGGRDRESVHYDAVRKRGKLRRRRTRSFPLVVCINGIFTASSRLDLHKLW